MSDFDRPPNANPVLDEEEAARQRGEDPRRSVGGNGRAAPRAEPDPNWRRDDAAVATWQGIYDNLAGERRPRREHILPYLLIRSVTPGDRGQRPLWPPTPVWESPDILLIDASYAGPFDPSRLVGTPTAGHTYRVFVRVWNLGRFPAYGVHVRLWTFSAGFVPGAPSVIGGTMTDLDDRTRPDSNRIVEIDQHWHVPRDAAAHDCLLASASCPGDQWSGTLDVANDRHVAQRNLTILTADQDTTPLLALLGEVLPMGATLEITHAGITGGRILQALTGGRLWRTSAVGEPIETRVDPAPLELLHHGIPSDAEQHLLTVVREPNQTVFARSDGLAELLPHIGRPPIIRKQAPVGHRLKVQPPSADHPAEPQRRWFRPGEIRNVLRQLDRSRLHEFAAVTSQPLRRALPQAVAKMIDVGDLRASTAAQALGGRSGQQHVLRFTATDAEGKLIGGYTLVVA